MKEENTSALEELEMQLENERDSKRAEIAAGYEQEIEDIKKELRERQEKVSMGHMIVDSTACFLIAVDDVISRHTVLYACSETSENVFFSCFRSFRLML